MENKQLLPFERNRYYAGKMLTSADFLAEQTYFNNKRRFLNSIMYGDGIACGYGVYSLDDHSILIESGVAVDSLGREIVIEKSIVQKLSAIEGFEQLKTNEATLCLRYAEKKIHSVYAVGKSEREEAEFNRISEEYELLLIDSADADYSDHINTEFLAKGMLFSNEDYKIEVEIPATVCKGKLVKLVVSAEKLSIENKSLSYSSILQIPAFFNEDNTHEINIDFEQICLEKGERVSREYWLEVQPIELTETDIVLKTGTAVARLDDVYADVLYPFSLKIAISDILPRYIVDKEIGKVSLESRNIGEQNAWVKLADIKLVRRNSSYLIDEITENQKKKYIQTMADEMLRKEYMDYFSKTENNRQTENVSKVKETTEKTLLKAPDSGIEVATGILEIPLGDHVRRGDIRYSGEIMHGLGKGNVYVEIGYECIAEDQVVGANSKSTIYGNPSLFQTDNENLSMIETAVKVLNDKGSFVVAAKLAKDVGFLVLTYQWVAIKFPTGNAIGETGDAKNKSIQAETPTVVLGVKESYYFGVRFTNMDNCSIAYELSENGSGEITSDGVYTAPGKEGVYEIRIYCTDNPIICTYAYAIVKKTNEEAEPEEQQK